MECVLAEEGISKTVIDRIIDECNDTGYAKAQSKSILGSMNDRAFHYKYHILEAGGVHSYHVPGIIRKLNRLPMGTIDYAYPIEMLNDMIEK